MADAEVDARAGPVDAEVRVPRLERGRLRPEALVEVEVSPPSTSTCNAYASCAAAAAHATATSSSARRGAARLPHRVRGVGNFGLKLQLATNGESQSRESRGVCCASALGQP